MQKVEKPAKRWAFFRSSRPAKTPCGAVRDPKLAHRIDIIAEVPAEEIARVRQACEPAAHPDSNPAAFIFSQLPPASRKIVNIPDGRQGSKTTGVRRGNRVLFLSSVQLARN
jgi:hypothetical protein